MQNFDHLTEEERKEWNAKIEYSDKTDAVLVDLRIPSAITTAKIHAICARLREHRASCNVCENETHFAGNSGMLAEPPVIVCGEAKLILLDIFV